MRDGAIAGLMGMCTLVGALPAHAWEFRVRFLERTGIETFPFTDTFDASDLGPHRLRLQLGVFDDAAGEAPAGGFLGWNVGGIEVSGAEGNSNETRTPGRLSPFNFAEHVGSNGDPPLPDGDPFTSLRVIDATLGFQSPLWTCDPEGMPLPMPPALVRGRNTFISIYEITIDPSAAAETYTITFSGNLLAATEWRPMGTPLPPDCPPGGEPTPGSVTYLPLATEPVAFSHTLTIVIPAPGAAALGVGLLIAARRRRT